MKASAIIPGFTKQSFLFKGPFGFGKTLAAASFAVEGPVYLSYWDKKSPIELLTFFSDKRFGSLGKKILDNIEFDTYSSNNANEYLNKLLTFQNNCPYVAIINDSLTYMTSAAVNWSLNFGKSKNLDRNIKNMLPEWDEYKIETSLITQCMDISKNLPCHVIWTAHPLPSTKIEGTGSTIRVSKVNSLVSYGSKVAGMVPGGFTEIYHFSQQSNWDAAKGTSSKRFIAALDSQGDEFAKSPILGEFVKEIDFTDKLFYQVWKELVDKSYSVNKEEVNQSNEVKPSEIKSPWKV